MKSDSFQHKKPRVFKAAGRAFFGKCPNCGQGKLFQKYLKQVSFCSECKEQFSHIRPDDAAPWLTIFIVGHIVVPLILIVEMQLSIPLLSSMIIWSAITLILTLITLPRAKGLILSLIWSTNASGSEHDYK